MTDRATETTNLLGRVLGAFDAAEIRWVLLRGRAGLGVAGHDVDLLVAGDDIDAADDIIFAMGGMALPRATHPWHRFYLVDDTDTGKPIVLDIVTEIIYSRRQQIRSGLETICLDRRRRDGGIWVLDPTDMFWTVLLHSLLDKDCVTERRRAELRSVVGSVAHPSPGEAFFDALCPSGWSAERALAAVVAEDWGSLTMVGRQMSAVPRPHRQTGPGDRSEASEGGGAVRGRRLAPFLSAPRRIVRSGARAAYPTLWRRAGLGVTPRILDVVEAAAVDAIVVSLRRRPGFCDVELLVADQQVQRLARSLREHHYRRSIGGWIRSTDVGLERLRLVAQSQLGLSGPAWLDLRATSSPMDGRVHCRRASAGTRVLVAAAAVSGGWVPRRRTGQLRSASSRAWAEAQHLATHHGLFSQLEFLAHGQQELTKVPERVIGKRVLRRRGHGKQLRVSFSGLDGAGKSSQIDALAAAADGYSVDVLWLPTRVWPEPLLNRLPAAFRSRLGPRRRTTRGKPRSSRGGTAHKDPARGVRAVAWTAVATLAAISVGLSLRRRASSSAADLVVLDRYRLDSLVKLQCWYPDVSPEWLTRIVMALAPAPDVELLLRVDAEVAYARKAEQWSVQQLANQARLYDRLAAQVPRVVVLDAHREADDLASDVISQVGGAFDES